MLLFGAAAQFGIFVTLSLETLLGFNMADAAAIGSVGTADGPTALFVANLLGSGKVGAIMVVAYSYMAPERGRLTRIVPKPMGSSSEGSISFLMAR